MKNIFLGLILLLVLLPQVSFAANASTLVDPQLAAFTKQQDADSQTFFSRQAGERGAFIQAHRDIIDRIDRRARDRRKSGDTTLESPSAFLSAQDSSTMSAFVQKQQADKEAFLAKQAQDRQAFLNSQASTSTASTPTVTAP